MKKKNKVIPYRSELRAYARILRRDSTCCEKILWERIRKRALGVQFHRQVPLQYYIVDFYCHEIGLAIEIDGSSHDNKFLYDVKRQRRLEAEGVIFKRFSNEEIENNISFVLEVLKEKIEEITKEY